MDPVFLNKIYWIAIYRSARWSFRKRRSFIAFESVKYYKTLFQLMSYMHITSFLNIQNTKINMQQQLYAMEDLQILWLLGGTSDAM